jgi:hypothetical protein
MPGRSNNKYIFIIYLLAISFCRFDSAAKDEDSVRTLLRYQEQFTTQQILRGDTLRKDSSKISGTTLPGGSSERYSPSQDSAYFKALRVDIPTGSRIQMSFDVHSPFLLDRLKSLDRTPWANAKENLSNIDPKLLQPTAQEMTQYQTNIYMSQYVPFVSYPRVGGLSIPLSDIASFFGIAEDVSPIIQYQLDFAADVEIVIYSVSAAVVAKIFEGHQPAGSYRVAWNLRNDDGRKMTTGDYIAEVRVLNVKTIRKRIVIP